MKYKGTYKLGYKKLAILAIILFIIMTAFLSSTDFLKEKGNVLKKIHPPKEEEQPLIIVIPKKGFLKEYLEENKIPADKIFFLYPEESESTTIQKE